MSTTSIPGKDQRTFGQRVDITNLIGLSLVHITALLACMPYFFSWSGVWIAVALWMVSGWLGICLCYHRLLTHRSFETSRWLRYFLTILGTLALQGGPIQWVGTHRFHHSDPDGDTDPHSPNHGFTWAHVLWVITKDRHGRNPASICKDLASEGFMVFMNKFHWVPQMILAVSLFGVGTWFEDIQLGLSWVIWGISVRTALTYNFTWFVNSAAHTWGYQNFKTNDRSKNLWWVAPLSFGEGWHNNHHGQPRSAAHGMRWFEFDPTYLLILTLEKLRLVRKVVRPELKKMDLV